MADFYDNVMLVQVAELNIKFNVTACDSEQLLCSPYVKETVRKFCTQIPDLRPGICNSWGNRRNCYAVSRPRYGGCACALSGPHVK